MTFSLGGATGGELTPTFYSCGFLPLQEEEAGEEGEEEKKDVVEEGQEEE